MRASRLINILTTLQARGLVTARELAEENGVTLRTIYRDIDQLSLAGIPVYAERGSEGGYRLLDGYRVKLNGLNPAEAEALFLGNMAGSPAADLGLGAVIANAETKLRAALPESLRESAGRLSKLIYMDAPGWHNEAEHPQFLQAVFDAVWNHKRIRMHYRTWKKDKDITTEPLGIVLKGGAWYLAAKTDGDIRTYRVSRILDLNVTEERFEPPSKFDLPAHWSANTDRLDAEMHPLTARILLTDMGLKLIRHFASGYAVKRMEVVNKSSNDGRFEARLPVGAIWQAATELLKLGPEVEVLEPPELRTKMAELSRATADLYSSDQSG